MLCRRSRNLLAYALALLLLACVPLPRAGALAGRLQYCVVDATGALLGYMEYGERGADDARTLVIRACESVAVWQCTHGGLAELAEGGYIGIRFITEECDSRLSLADAEAAMADTGEDALLELLHSGASATLTRTDGETRADYTTLLT